MVAYNCIACGNTGVASNGNPCFACRAISPSQWKLYSRCETKWWYHYVAGEDMPSTPAAEFGSAVHARLESHYNGQPASSDDAAALAAEMLPLLPPPSPALQSELSVRFVRESEGSRWWYRGTIDLIDTSRQWISDHKTSSNPRRYGLDERRLPYDPAAVIYAHAAMVRYGWQTVDLQWTYAATRKNRCKPYTVRATLTIDETEQRLQTLDRTSLQLIRAKRIERPEDARPNASECGSFGGCPYLAICPYTKRNPLARAISAATIQDRTTEMAIDQDALQKLIAAQLGQQQPAAPAAPAAPEPQPQPAAPQAAAPAQANADVLALIAQQQQQAAAPAPQPTPQAAAPQPTPQAAAPQPTPQGKGFTLYLRCVPLDQTVDSDPGYDLADQIIASAAQDAAAANSVAHYREIDYGKAQSALVYHLEKLLRTQSRAVVLLPGVECRDAEHTFRRLAKRIVMAV